jgi:hypothetical protein
MDTIADVGIYMKFEIQNTIKRLKTNASSPFKNYEQKLT